MNLTWSWANEYFQDLPPIKLDDRTIAHRRNFLVALGIVTCYYVVGIRPGGFSGGFVSGTFERPELVEWILWLIVAYEAVMYHSTRMGDEIKYYTLREDYFKYRAAANFSALRVAARAGGLDVDADKEGGHRGHRIEPAGSDEFVGLYRFTRVSTASGANKVKSLEDGVQLLLQLGIPGLTASPDPQHHVEFRHPERAEEARYLSKAFPRIRRLALLEFMQVWFPYWAFFASAAVRIWMLAPWGNWFSWAVCC